MKKILAFILCAMLIFALPVVAYAEEGDSANLEQNEVVTENLPSENETAIEGEISPPEDKPITEIIVDYVKEHFEEISVIGTLLLTIFYEVRKHGKLNGSIGILNNNAISVATSSADAINKALAKVEGIAGVVDGYKQEMSSLLGEIRKNAEEKDKVENMLLQVESYLKTAKCANVEFANELAELLNLANIPNAKKDEMYARHTTAVHKLEAMEEVIHHDGTEA